MAGVSKIVFRRKNKFSSELLRMDKPKFRLNEVKINKVSVVYVL